MTATNNVPSEGSSFGEGLPKSFVQSMRTLFDIMDDQHTGYVKFTEFEHRWQEDTQGLPQGVLASLRKVTPPDGYLSFERFCSGLKMCLLRNQGPNSLEILGPLSSSSPHTSPHRHSRPLSAPLLDQETYQAVPIINGNLFQEPANERHSLHKHNKYDDDNDIYHANKVYAGKSDIRMGVGGIKSVIKSSRHSHLNSIGPPKPPRFPEGEVFTQQNWTSRTETQMTNSLERESRGDKKWNKQREENHKSNTIRKDRGGSLERLLDTGNHQRPKENSYGPPLNKTGMKSAIQSWFKEKSKSDLQRSDKNNNYHNKLGTHRHDTIYKESRTQKQPRLKLESTYRGIGDGGDSHRILSKSGRLIPPPPPTGVAQPHIAMSVASPQMVVSHGRNPSLPISSQYSNNSQAPDKVIYGKVMETATAVPITYNGNGQISRNVPGSHIGTTGAVAHGHYVAPQPPQMALNKKTLKKKEPRRHTLQNGVDQNVMKRLRQLEAERDMLYQGLDVVDRARSWYKQQLLGISERIQYLPFGPAKAEPTMERQQEKLHFQLARISEINSHLKALMDASDKGLPAQLNLAIRGTASVIENFADKERSSERLKQQNKLLTEEVSEKSERITALEREKAALLRELFQTRAKQRPPNADSTFM